jgi:BirA family transcriptional regulator, biotin operon repressor / biotin---[acetyl-CoA-carboxylase] ligase
MTTPSRSRATGRHIWSVVVRSEAGAPASAGVALTAGLAVADVLASAVGERWPIRIKWPNDVLLDGRKVAGVLVESFIDDGFAVVGIGINLHSAPDARSTAFPATSVQDATGMALPVGEAATLLCDAFLRWYGIWLREGAGEALRRAVTAKLWRLGEEVCVTATADAAPLRGLNRGIDSQGALLLERDGAVQSVLAGDVTSQGSGNA